MPWYLADVPYDYAGDPELAQLCQVVGEEQGVMAMAVAQEGLPRHYGTINIVNALGRGERVVGVSCCQNARTYNFLEMGAVLGEAIRRSGRRVVILASGALSHKFVNIDWEQVHPRIFHPDNVSSPRTARAMRARSKRLCAGRHDEILADFDSEYRKTPGKRSVGTTCR